MFEAAAKKFIDPNVVDYRESWPSVGTVDLIDVRGQEIAIEGDVQDMVDGSALLIVDAAKRFVGAAPAQQGKFRVTVPDRHLKISAWPLRAYVYSDDSNKAYPIDNSAAAQKVQGRANDIPSIEGEMRDLVVTAMQRSYTSTSSHNDIKTGNSYQSIDFDKLITVGGRPNRNKFFDHVNFKGKTVLDIGANTGELSRLARKRGAALVDGYEYDKYFVEQGRLINAAIGMTRVSLFQGDATNRDLYEGMKYDMVMTFAVWVYTDKVLDRLAEITDVVFFETHTLDHGLEMYTKPMSQHFPSFRILGYDELPDMRKSRCVLMFAKTPEQLDEAVKVYTLKVEPYFENAFFERHKPTTSEELPAYAARIGEIARQDKTVLYGIGRPYFEAYLAGYSDFLRDGRVTMDNFFLKKYVEAVTDKRLDQHLLNLVQNETLLLQKISKKYEDLQNGAAGRWHLVPPIQFREKAGSHLHLTRLDGTPIRVENIDGHHRFFNAQLLGKQTIDAIRMEPANVQREVVQNNYKIEGRAIR